MWAVVLNVMFLGLGAAALLDLALGFSSGLLQLAHADQTLAPSLFRRCMVSEAVIAAGAIAWFSFGAAL
jgi:hypothetical protein